MKDTAEAKLAGSRFQAGSGIRDGHELRGRARRAGGLGETVQEVLRQQRRLQSRSGLARRQEQRRFEIDGCLAGGDLPRVGGIEDREVGETVLHAEAQPEDLRAQAGPAHAQQQRVAIAPPHLFGKSPHVRAVRGDPEPAQPARLARRCPQGLVAVPESARVPFGNPALREPLHALAQVQGEIFELGIQGSQGDPPGRSGARSAPGWGGPEASSRSVSTRDDPPVNGPRPALPSSYQRRSVPIGEPRLR